MDIDQAVVLWDLSPEGDAERVRLWRESQGGKDGSMKRRLALLMAFVLIVCASVSTYATESGAPSQAGQGSVESGSIAEQSSEAQAGSQESGSQDSDAGNGSQESGVQDSAAGNQSVEPSTPDSTAEDGSQEPSAPDSSAEDGSQESGTPDSDAEDGEQDADAGSQGTGTGNDVQGKDICQVDVSIGAALIRKSPVTFYISLTDSNGVKKEGAITLSGDDGSGSEEGLVRFLSLKEGKYTLQVLAEGFAAYTQEISVRGKETLRLMTGFLGGMNYVQGAAHPGVLLIGDVNKDGVINEADRAALMDVIEGGDATGLAADLNGDGRIDIVDLEYFARGYKESRDTLAKIESAVPAAAIRSKEGAGTQVDGSLSALLEEGESVSLATKDGKAISETNPVELSFDFLSAGNAGQADGILIETGDDTSVTSAFINIAYTDADGKAGETGPIPMNTQVRYLLTNSDVRAEIDENGNIVVHLGSQVALKRVTLTITGTEDSSNLAEISTVEFVNGMENRIPEPEMDIPQDLKAVEGNKAISLSWGVCINITGYEVEVTNVASGLSETILVPKNALDIVSFGGKELVNYQEYRIRVQSVNGTWRSGYGDAMSAIPKPSGKPDKPDNVSAVGKYKSIVVSWKQMKDTLSYNLYYRKSSDSEYQMITGITANSYTLTGLEDLTEYTVYVTGVNELGESNPSLTAAAVTTDLNPAVITKYGMINIGESGAAGAHIISATMNGKMEASPLDVQQGTAWGTVDQDPFSYYSKGTWDDGGFNNMSLKHGLTYEFDQAYKMDTFAFRDATSADTGISYVQVRYWDDAGKETYYRYGQVALQSKRDDAGRVYYVVKLPEPVNVKKIQFGLARYTAQGSLTVSDVYFYYYDTLTEDIMNLYADDLHTTLRPEVTQADIDALRIRVNTIDEISGEYHPDRELLERELQTAEAILKDTALNAAVEIHSGISTRDENRGFGGLNAWQPLGVVAAAQEEIVVYVGHNSKKTGENANLQLVVTQYHSEASGVSNVVGTLKVGANKITVPKLGSTTGVESGGALYVQYTGNGGANDRYAVRVSGGVQVPRLDLYQLTDSAERLERAKAYVTAVETFVGQMEEQHGRVHMNSENKQVAYAYDETNCILGASDILLDTMMLSLPAKQLLAGTGRGTVEERAERLLDSMQAMEDMMYLFYQHKGLNANATDARDRVPKGHLNIRYQRMFSGAFMYASGNHIGIEWGSAPGMTGAVPVQADSQGRYVSGCYFGWGIAHEIGHCINQGTYAVAEVTNNYFAVLAQAKDENGSVRFQYENVYDKVTSGAKGAASNVFTQLGMYWQLHLAYDRGYNFKTYENYEEQLANLFFARVDTYSRNTAKAPQPGGVALKLAGEKDQNLIRLSCAAAQKNLLDFFERWGMTPNEETRAYAQQFEKETRAIYYVNDDARAYTLQGGTSSLGTSGTVEAVGDDIVVGINGGNANHVNFILKSKGIPAEDVLGYEITRCTISGGETMRETVGFTTDGSFTDEVYMNNRVVWYEIAVIDKYLNRSAVKSVEPMKIEHEGELDKAFWSISTQNLTAPEVPVEPGNDDAPCAPEAESPAGLMIDGDGETVYTATANGTAEILIEFNKTLTVAGFKYRVGSGTKGSYVIQVLQDDTWVEAASGSFAADGAGTVHFENPDGKYVSTYAATALKLVWNGGGQISVAELDVLGVTGDNVDFRRAGDGTAAIGKLTADYKYGSNPEDVIPAGSIIFTGSYKGNPAYNAVLLYDQDGRIVGGVDAQGNLKASQVILADVPAEGDIQNVSDGTWIYWIESGWETDLKGIQKVRAELYRVNDALTNEGQRLVSDSLFETLPQTLPEIELSGGSIPQR